MKKKYQWNDKESVMRVVHEFTDEERALILEAIYEYGANRLYPFRIEEYEKLMKLWREF